MTVGKIQLAKGVAALAAVLVVGGWLLFWFVGVFTQADKSIQAAIIAAFVAVFSLAFTFWKERTRSIREAHREQKIKIYEIFYDIVFELLDQSKKGTLPDDLSEDGNFQKRWTLLTRGAVFFGSPKVLMALSKVTTAASTATDPLLTIKNFGAVFLAMRDDIGLSNSGLDELSIHQIYVKDDLKKLGKPT